MKLVALAGGVGGAKLVQGLAQILNAEDLTIIVNTGDDFEHLGLYICPDLDTICYTLAGLADPSTGWGRANESWQAITNIGKLGGPDWFRMGDQDIATDLERTRRMREGQSLSQVTRDFCRTWGIQHAVLPMSDQPVRTIVETDSGDLAFQEYFVHRSCEPRVKGFHFDGIQSAKLAPGIAEALAGADAVVICPSNPWVSIGPMLKIDLLQSTLHAKKVLAVSPIIGGQSIKGPAAKMYAEMGIKPSALAVAQHYRELITGFILDHRDAQLDFEIRNLGLRTSVTNTLMNNLEDRRRLAQDVLNFAATLL
jgi:LPPG:FO 2-phospho-L-lactate transferase